MEFKIETDLVPIKSGIPHSRDNWTSPEADKMNDAYDYLLMLEHSGFLKLWYDSKTQKFTVNKDECKGLTEKEANGILFELELELEKIRSITDRSSGFIDPNEIPKGN